MPHCIIEYAKDVEQIVPPKKLIKCLHQAALSSELFEEASIKSRTIAYENYQTGISDIPFVHVTIKILQGRDHQQKKTLSNLLIEALSTLFKSPISLSVEVLDIEKISYSKTVIQ